MSFMYMRQRRRAPSSPGRTQNPHGIGTELLPVTETSPKPEETRHFPRSGKEHVRSRVTPDVGTVTDFVHSGGQGP